jgi:hypothetical protein
VQSDAGLMPEPGAVLEGFGEEIERLLDLERATH